MTIKYFAKKYGTYFVPLIIVFIFGLIVYVLAGFYGYLDHEAHTSEYNEIQNPSFYRDFLSDGYSYMGDTNLITMNQPQELDSVFYEFSFRFIDDGIVDQVEVIYVDITKPSLKERAVEAVSNAFYKPQKGINRFKVPKTLLEKGSTMMVGFFWKNELGVKKIPRYEKVSYHVSP